MTTYAIDSADGNNITTGLSPEVYARRVAQRMANERSESVYLYPLPVETDEDGEGTGDDVEEIAPA